MHKPFLPFHYREEEKKDDLFQNLFWNSEMLSRRGVLYTRAFTGCLADELGPYSTKKKKIVSTFFAAILGFHGAEVQCKFWLNWTIMEAVFKQPVRRRETIQAVGLCVPQSPSIIAVIL